MENKVDKGQYAGSCNRTACQKPNAVYYNHSTRLYYCGECAILLNNANPESLKIHGNKLCTLGKGNISVNELRQEIEQSHSHIYHSLSDKEIYKYILNHRDECNVSKLGNLFADYLLANNLIDGVEE